MRQGEVAPPHCIEIDNTTEKGETPSHRVCVERDTMGRGDPCHPHLERNTTEKGETPSCRVCVKETRQEMVSPFLMRPCQRKHGEKG
jgi:hypothetical protein